MRIACGVQARQAAQQHGGVTRPCIVNPSCPLWCPGKQPDCGRENRVRARQGATLEDKVIMSISNTKATAASGAVVVGVRVRLRRRGWTIIPTRGKKPGGRWKQFQTLPADELTCDGCSAGRYYGACRHPRQCIRRLGVQGSDDATPTTAGPPRSQCSESPADARTPNGYHTYFTGQKGSATWETANTVPTPATTAYCRRACTRMAATIAG